MTDATGLRSFAHDFNGRLLSKGGPEGPINYTRDLAENLTQINATGVLVNYTYDALNRLSTVQNSDTGTTTYAYDNVGNLQSVTYPNGVVHSYSYDTRNRLTNLGVSGNTAAPGQPAVAGTIASYAYTLDAAGHRLSASELSGRTVNYGYDNLYRLTSETIAADPHAINGAVNYTYDPVGNRTQLTSTLAAIPAGTFNYDANDRFTVGDQYDAGGNTISSGGIADAYDFENHLIQQGGVTLAYDGDGNRVSKTIAGATALYLVDTENPTGYAQVLAEENAQANPQKVYVYGLELISQHDRFVAGDANRYYVYDGHGSVRALTDSTGAVTDTYDYDAFGNEIHSTFSGIPPAGTAIAPTPNNYLFAGEQFDPDLHLYYNRARYLNISTDRFWTMDTDEGIAYEPASLHKYLYGGANPVDNIDRSGHDFGDVAFVAGEEATIGAEEDAAAISIDRFPHDSV